MAIEYSRHLIYLKAVKYMFPASLLIYDYFLTLDQEIALVWCRKWGLGTLLFAVNRYVPFAAIFFNFQNSMKYLSPELCKTKSTLTSSLTALGMFSAEVILALRTIALWNNHRIIKTMLIIMLLAVGACSLTISHFWNKSLKFTIDDHSPGCYYLESNRANVFNYVLLLASETVIAGLTAVRARYHASRSKSGWLTELYQQGFMFYMFGLAVLTVNVLWPFIGQAQSYKDETLLTFPAAIVHSVLCNRVVFVIRKGQSACSPKQADFENGGNDTSDIFSTVMTMSTFRHVGFPNVPGPTYQEYDAPPVDIPCEPTSRCTPTNIDDSRSVYLAVSR